jgi:hypothetical protein
MHYKYIAGVFKKLSLKAHGGRFNNAISSFKPGPQEQFFETPFGVNERHS